MWTETVMSPIYDEEGRPLDLCGSTRNITERKRLEDALRRSEHKWRSVFEFLPVGLSVVDGKDKVTDCNPALAQVLDMTLEGILAGRYAQRRNSMPT